MQRSSSDIGPAAEPKVPWNKGKVIGAKPPLQIKHVWSIRTKLQIDGKKRVWQCSISRSTASCEGVMSSASRSRMSLLVVWQPIELASASAKPGIR